jgi:hypothetical protein
MSGSYLPFLPEHQKDPARDPARPERSRRQARPPGVRASPAQDRAAILTEVRSLRNDFDRFRKTHGEFAVRTTNEIDELFAKVAHIIEVRTPGKLTERRLKKLDYLLTSRSNEAMTFSEIGKIHELGRRDEKANTRPQAMTKFGKILASKTTCYEVTESIT